MCSFWATLYGICLLAGTVQQMHYEESCCYNWMRFLRNTMRVEKLTRVLQKSPYYIDTDVQQLDKKTAVRVCFAAITETQSQTAQAD